MVKRKKKNTKGYETVILKYLVITELTLISSSYGDSISFCTQGNIVRSEEFIRLI